MLRLEMIMKNRVIIELNVVYNTDVGYDVCHAGFWCL